MIFPNLAPQYYDNLDKSVLPRMEQFYQDCITINQSYWSEADTNTRFEANDADIYSNFYGNLPFQGRRTFNFNRIRPIVNMITGHQRRNRKSMICTPVENADAHTADQFTKVLLWLTQKEGILETISDAFQGACVAGLNFLHVWVDYRSDPISGDIKVDNKHYNSIIVDPYFRKHDMSDCNGIWSRSFMAPAAAASLLPDHAEEIVGMVAKAGAGRDGKFQYMPESFNLSFQNLLTYDEFYYRDYRKQLMLVDVTNGETFEWKSEDRELMSQFLRMHKQLTVIEQDVPTVKLAIVVQGKVIYHGPNVTGDDYPFIPMFAYYNPQIPYFPLRVQSVVTNLRDAQYLYSRRRNIELDILESQITSGYIYKENALVNPADVFLHGQGKGVALKEDANITDIIPIQAPSVPPSMIALSEALGKEIMTLSGVNEELMGSAVDDKAGILSMLRQGAGLTTLEGLFDQLDRTQKLLGKQILKIVQQNFTPGKINRILEDQPSPEFYNKNFGIYDIVIEDGLNTATQKQMQFAQYLHLREVGVPIPDDVLIESATIQNKKELLDSIRKASEQRDQIQQQQTQVAIEESQARTALANARAVADQGLGYERLSRVEENKALAEERRAQANKDEEEALMNYVKILKELEGLDLTHLHKLVTIAQALKGDTAQDAKPPAEARS